MSRLLPEERRRRLPNLYASGSTTKDEVVVQAKVFEPCGRFALFIVEFDGEDVLFGYCVSPLGPDCDERGYSPLAELESVRNRLGLPLELDLHFRHTKWRDLWPVKSANSYVPRRGGQS